MALSFSVLKLIRTRIERRVRTGYCDRMALTLDEALTSAKTRANRNERSQSVWWATARSYCPRLCGAASRSTRLLIKQARTIL